MDHRSARQRKLSRVRRGEGGDADLVGYSYGDAVRPVPGDEDAPWVKEIESYEFASSGAEAQSLVARKAPGILGSAWGYNDSGSAVYVQFFDDTSAPSNGDTPKISQRVGDGAVWSVDERPGGIRFHQGIVIAYSSTADTFTGAGSSGWIHARHRE